MQNTEVLQSFSFLKMERCLYCVRVNILFLKRQLEQASLCILLLQSSSNVVRLIIAKAEIL